MRTGFDQLAKRIGKSALGPSGLTVVHDEIHPDAQHADLRHEPDPARGAERARLGLLGRMAEVPCLIEIYAHPPDGEELRACLGKHIAFWQQRTRAARKARKRRGSRGQAGAAAVAAVEPFLWVVAAGRPSALLTSLKFEPSRGWPEGVYELSEILRVGIVSAAELPRDRSTLLVRLMAAGPLLSNALTDLAALPRDAHERAVASQILLALRHALAKKARRSPEEQEFIMRIEIDYEEQLFDKGRKEGREEERVLGARRSLRRVLAARGLVPSRAEAARIDACADLATLDRWLDQAAVAETVEEALRQPPPRRAASGRRKNATSA